jgi:hypothetical protein
MFGGDEKDGMEHEAESEGEGESENEYSPKDQAIKDEALGKDNLRDALAVLVEKASDKMLADCVDDVMEQFC